MTMPPMPHGAIWINYRTHGPEGAFSADQMLAYGAACAAAGAAAERETISGAPVPVGLPAGEQTGPVAGAPTYSRGEPILWYRDFGAGPMICNPDRPDALRIP